jgi:hypothetical protein
MRRREQLRALQNLRAGQPSAEMRRGFLQAKAAVGLKPLLAPVRMTASRGPTRIATTGNRFIPPQPRRGAQSMAPAASMNVPFAMRRPGATAPREPRKMNTQMAPAGIVRSRLAARLAQEKRRDFSVRLAPAKRIQRRRRISPSPGGQLLRAQGKPALHTTPLRGNALRVSFACRLRPKPMPARTVALAPRMSAELRAREDRRTLRAIGPQEARKRQANSAGITAGAIVLPTGPLPLAPGAQVGRGPVRPRMLPISASDPLTARPAEGPGMPPAEVMAFPEMILAHGRLGWSQGAPATGSRPAAISGQSSRKQLVAPFVPQDMSYGLSLNVNQSGNKDQKK